LAKYRPNQGSENRENQKVEKMQKKWAIIYCIFDQKINFSNNQ